MNRRITDPHPMPGDWYELEDFEFPEPNDETDFELRAAVFLGYLVLVLGMTGLACLWVYAA